jgi:hypothetical protein
MNALLCLSVCLQISMSFSHECWKDDQSLVCPEVRFMCSIHECRVNLHVSVCYFVCLLIRWVRLRCWGLLGAESERVTSFSQSCSDHIGDVNSQARRLFEILSSSTTAYKRACFLDCWMRSSLCLKRLFVKCERSRENVLSSRAYRILVVALSALGFWGISVALVVACLCCLEGWRAYELCASQCRRHLSFRRRNLITLLKFDNYPMSMGGP